MADLLQVHIASAEHTRNFGTGRCLDQALQQRSDRGCGSALDHQLAMRHDPHHRIKDVCIRQGNDVIHVVLHNAEGVLPYALYT